MPDEEKLQNGQDEVEEESQPKKALPIKKYGVYGLIVMVMMAAAYFVTLKVVKPMLAGGEASVEEKADDHDEPGESSHGESKNLDEHGSGEGDKSDVFLVEDLIVNPAGTGGRRFLSTSIGFELSSPKASDLFEKREAIVRDALITILSSQSIPELSDFKQREKLRKLIELRVEKLLHTDEVAAVYFTEFVLQ
jgi:flagellar FliL protein